ncbi:PepSY domain-containing protein [Roseibium denhamense]|uniref:Peptidase propeptide and YPEB domain-containing protein n=1 Tax=Roseibium denhamense TaxID=76305 RepID=A0ABY1N7L4_9HYPH|nr:PepSY domain-containing protein [Roseibium denhamense]MTI06036.1 PepSY domain-containing protein [Roseibium denhamense]SMP01859.1 Peptidase propeptide and YPEB domain-containing protein [Roseibium denhamense]
MLKTKKYSALSILSSCAVIAVAGGAMAAASLGETVGTTDEEIRAALTAHGYTVEEIEREGGELEVEVTLNGQAMEFGIDPTSGQILEMELEDDTDDSDE